MQNLFVMGSIDVLTVEDMLDTNEMTISNGETVSGKEYLDRAIKAFGLKSCDYYTALMVLKLVAKGHDANHIVTEVKEFWKNFEGQY